MRLLDRVDLGRVLDLMCGVGGHLHALMAEGIGWQSYTGVDVSSVVLDAARSSRPAHPRVRFVNADVVRWCAEPGASDTVLLMYEALNALGPEQSAVVLRAIATALAPGGLALVDAALATGPPQTGHAAAQLSDPHRLVLSSAVDAGSTADEHHMEHTAHHLFAGDCLLHFGYRWWAPSRARMRDLFHDAGLKIRSEHQAHAGIASDKPSVPNAVQFVLGKR
ncbi:class I SAM-dependent methyltransferase [Streptomyces olivaceus]|uniref:class I SAM-dependent methyltransferase n=1 Tax=Streptomyces olivaceus TaxID=47716 RepID=UPI00369AA58B